MSPASRSTTAALDADPTAEVARLRLLLDRQPSCLMRIAVDGTLLAVNDTALSLLSARRLSQVFATSILDRVGSEAALLWTDFVSRVANAGSASMECELTDLAGISRMVMVHGVTYPAHPDGVESLFVTIRDISTARRLEVSLQEQEGATRTAQIALRDATLNLHQLEEQLAQVVHERSELRTMLDSARTDREQLLETLKQLKTALTTAVDATLLAELLVDKGQRT